MKPEKKQDALLEKLTLAAFPDARFDVDESTSKALICSRHPTDSGSRSARNPYGTRTMTGASLTSGGLPHA